MSKPCLISLVRSWALWDVYLSKTSNTPSRAIPRDILKREVKDYVSNCESLLRYLKLESISPRQNCILWRSMLYLCQDSILLESRIVKRL